MTTNDVKKSLVRKALPKPNILQLSEYDITQKIMDSLTNACHRIHDFLSYVVFT